MSTTTVMYVEIDRSSPKTGSGAADSARSTNHVDAVRRAVDAQNGHLGMMLGEGLVARFDSAYRAARAARSIQQALELLERTDPPTAPAVRIGLAVGEVIDADPDGYDATIRARPSAVRRRRPSRRHCRERPRAGAARESW